MPIVVLHGHQVKDLLFPDELDYRHDDSLLGTSNES